MGSKFFSDEAVREGGFFVRVSRAGSHALPVSYAARLATWAARVMQPTRRGKRFATTRLLLMSHEAGGMDV